jgi:hypothetical protein
MATQARQQAAAERKAATLGQVGQLAASGDMAGARKAALGAGDFDITAQLDKMDGDAVARLKTIAESTAPIIAQLGKIPAGPARVAAFQQAAPMLAQSGYDATKIEQLAGQINDDGFIGLAVANGMKIADYQRQQNDDRQFGFDREKFGYQQQNDAANRGVTMRGQDITARGQNMADARSREAGARSTGGVPGAVKMTEGQAKDGFNAKRLAGAGAVVDQFENTPGFRPGATSIASYFGGGKSQQYESAKGEWVDALIRLTTGAAASKDEVDAAKSTYFPTPLDSGDTIAQKAEMRLRVMQDAVTRAGPGAAGSAPTAAAPKAAPKPAAKPASGWGKMTVMGN